MKTSQHVNTHEMKATITEKEITAIANSEHRDPFEILGMYEVRYNGETAMKDTPLILPPLGILMLTLRRRPV